MLTEPQIDRYARHILLREVGGVGQERILAAEVRIEGLGPVGEWAAIYLALAGVGRLVLCDPTPVDPLAGGPIFGASAAGKQRDEALAGAIGAWNPDVLATVDPGGANSGADSGAAVPSTSLAGATRLTSRAGGILAGAAGASAFLLAGEGCPACLAALHGQDAVDPAAAALAGSMAAGEILQLLLCVGSRPTGVRRFEHGLPVPAAPCVHG